MAGSVSVTVKIDLYRLQRFKAALDADLRQSGNGPVRKAMQEWGNLIGRFLIARYERFSMGGGDWRPLKPITIAGKIRRGLLLLILRATDVFFEHFAPMLQGKAGGLSQDIPFGVRVGFSGGMSLPHPGSKVSMSQLALWFQQGTETLPARKIVVSPDQTTIVKMREVMQQALSEMARKETAH